MFAWITVTVFILGCTQEASVPPNIVLVSLDTMRSDRVGAYGSQGGLTPNLDRFAQEGVVYESAYAQASETLFSHASLFTSRYPSELGALDYDFKLPTTEPTLAGVLKAYGYETAAFTGSGHLHPDFGFANGFDHYKKDVDWGLLYHAVEGLTQWLDASVSPAPKFLFVHGYDAHPRYLKPPPFGFLHGDLGVFGPGREAVIAPMGSSRVVDGYYFPGAEPSSLIDQGTLGIPRGENRDEWRSKGGLPSRERVAMSEADLQQIRGAYDGAVAYADAWFGLLMSELDSRGFLDNSVIVVLSDHGEELGENGLFNHRYSLSEPVLHVPLMLRLPGGKGGGRRMRGTVGLVDVMPTLLALANAEAPALARGGNLLQPQEETPAFSEGPFRSISARREAGRLTFTGIGADSPYLATVLRAAELEGPAFSWSDGLKAEDAAKLRDSMVDWRAQIVLANPPESSLSPEQREKLREKGYWEPQ